MLPKVTPYHNGYGMIYIVTWYNSTSVSFRKPCYWSHDFDFLHKAMMYGVTLSILLPTAFTHLDSFPPTPSLPAPRNALVFTWCPFHAFSKCELTTANYSLQVSIYSCNMFYLLFIDHKAREIMYLVASVCPFVCLRVCPSSPGWTVRHMTLIFGMVVDITISCLYLALMSRSKVKGWVQDQRSRLNVWHV